MGLRFKDLGFIVRIGIQGLGCSGLGMGFRV